MKKEYLLYFVFFVSLVATLGSLTFSEIMHFPPCVLCWYQRAMMYPLVLISAIGIIKKDQHLPTYILSLAGVGFLIAIYHNLLYYNILPEAAAPCVQGISCTTEFVKILGFMDIPFLSLLAFTLILISVVYYRSLETVKSKK